MAGGERENVTQQPYALSFTQCPQHSANNKTIQPEAGVMHWSYRKNPLHFHTNREFENLQLILKPLFIIAGNTPFWLVLCPSGHLKWRNLKMVFLIY
jgi:hypothetical protein